MIIDLDMNNVSTIKETRYFDPLEAFKPPITVAMIQRKLECGFDEAWELWKIYVGKYAKSVDNKE